MRLPGFQGTHIPGEHRIVAPSPPQIIIPERKITSVEEAAKWHATRGGAVAEEEEEEAEAVLLTDLVAGWALTSSANQTLSSAGVVASGPYNLNETGTLAYGATGVVMENDGELLSIPTSAGISSGSQAWRIAAWGGFNGAGGETQNLLIKFDEDFNNSDYELTYTLAGGNITGTAGKLVFDGEGPDVTTATGAYTPGQRRLFRAAFDPSTGTVYCQVNNGTIASATEMETWPTITTGDVYIGGNNAGGNASFISYVRLWIGDNALTLWNDTDFATWEYNSGTPRTDAEIAAYTGS